MAQAVSAGRNQASSLSRGNNTGSAPGMPMVLMYHSVEPYEADPYLVTVSPPRFAQQMHWLARRGLRGTSVRDLLAARAAGAGKGLVGLTFDDGYADFARHALPAEVGGSRRILQEITGKPVSGFGYPYGDLETDAVARVRDTGYDYGCAIWPSASTSRHALPR